MIAAERKAALMIETKQNQSEIENVSIFRKDFLGFE